MMSKVRVAILLMMVFAIVGRSDADSEATTAATTDVADPHIFHVPSKIPQGPHTIFQETFDNDEWQDKWVLSESPDYTGTKH